MVKIFGADIWTIICLILILISTVMTAFLMSRYAAGRFKDNKRKTAIFFMSISFLPRLLCYVFSDLP